MRETRVIFRGELHPWALALIALGLLVAAVWAYRRTTQPVSLRLKGLLIALRLVALAALFVCLLRPTLETTSYSVEKRPLTVLVDRSRSMAAIEDATDGRSRASATDQFLLNETSGIGALEDRYHVTVLPFARDVGSNEGRDDFWAAYSAYGRALEGALEHTPTGQCEGIVLVGDGSHNLGPPDPLDVAADLAARGIPLYTVGIGQEHAGAGFRDVKILSLDTPRSVYVLNTFPVRGRLLMRGCSGVTVRVRLELPGPRMQFMTVQASHDEEVVPVEFEAEAEEAGELKVTMQAEQVPGEALLDNNVRSTFVKVTGGGVRVAYYDSLRPESKFVSVALKGARQMTVRRVVVVGRGRLAPAEIDWDPYDVVMLGDVSAFCFGGDALDGLKAAVQNEGKGIILLAGKESLGEAGFRGTAIQDVLPAQLPTRWQYAEGERTWQVDPGHASHPILAIGEDASSTLSRWEQMPRLSGAAAGAEPKMGGIVLARDADGLALLAVQQAGAGRAACVLTDTTFRWFFTEGESQEEYKRFWRQLILWAGGVEQARDGRFWVALSTSSPAVGEPVTIRGHLVDAESRPVRDAKVALDVQAPDGARGPEIPMMFLREQGVFEAEYVPKAGGEYTVRCKATRGGEPVGEDVALFHAMSVDRELEDPRADLSLLRRLSAATTEAGGQYYPYGSADLLVAELAAKGRPLRLATSQWRDVWDRPHLFVVFLVALAAEWVIRKRNGLV